MKKYFTSIMLYLNTFRPDEGRETEEVKLKTACIEGVKEIQQSRHSSIQLSAQHSETKTNGLCWFIVSLFYIASSKVLSQLLLHRETLSGETKKKSQQVCTCCQVLRALDVKL